MGSNDYIKLYRKCKDNPLFLELPFDRWHAFEYLLIEAKRFPTDILLKGQMVHLEPGQWICGMDKLAETFGWSKNKLYRFLKLLKSEGMIDYFGTPNGTVISIENYGFYQCGEDKRGTADGTADGTPNGTADGTQIKKEKKEKKEKNRGLINNNNYITKSDEENIPQGGIWVRLNDEIDSEVF